MKKMTRKRFKKLLMAHGFGRNMAQDLIECVALIRQIDGVLNLTVEFCNGQRYRIENVRSYYGIYESLKKDGMSVV